MTTEKSTWYNMHKRCYDPKHSGFRTYGAVGITVCARRWATPKEQALNRRKRVRFSYSKHNVRHCPKGHPYSVENTIWKRASRLPNMPPRAITKLQKAENF